MFKSLCVFLVLRCFLLDFLRCSIGFLWDQSLCFSVCSRDPEYVFLSAVSLVSAMPVMNILIGSLRSSVPTKLTVDRYRYPVCPSMCLCQSLSLRPSVRSFVRSFLRSVVRCRRCHSPPTRPESTRLSLGGGAFRRCKRESAQC